MWWGSCEVQKVGETVWGCWEGRKELPQQLPFSAAI